MFGYICQLLFFAGQQVVFLLKICCLVQVAKEQEDIIVVDYGVRGFDK
jgi:hypothetical protein